MTRSRIGTRLGRPRFTRPLIDLPKALTARRAADDLGRVEEHSGQVDQPRQGPGSHTGRLRSPLTALAVAGYRPHSMRLEVTATWAAVVAWTVLIWSFGGDGFSSSATSRFLRPLLEWLLPGLSGENLDTMHLAVRKGAHAVEYGVLALLMLRAVLVTWALAVARAAVLAIAFALALASADEGRQALSYAGGNVDRCPPGPDG